MKVKGSWELIWVAIALCAVLACLIIVVSRDDSDPRVLYDLKSQRIGLVNSMRQALAAASDEQNYAVMSTNEQASKAFLEQAVEDLATFRQSRLELDKVVLKQADKNEPSLLDHVDGTFQEFQNVSEQLSKLAVQSSNRKAYALAFGPAMDHLRELDKVFEQLAAQPPVSQTEGNTKVLAAISKVRLSLLQIQVHLLPHIAEPSDQKMDELEKRIAEEDIQIQEGLHSLTSSLNASIEMAKMVTLYNEFKEIETQVIALSRENSDIRSVALALNEKRKAMLACEEALVNLENVVRAESIETNIPKGRGQ